MRRSTLDYQPDVTRFTTVHVAPPRTVAERPRTFAEMVMEIPGALRDAFQRIDLALTKGTIDEMRDALNGALLPLVRAQVTASEMALLFDTAKKPAPRTVPLLQPGRMPAHVIRPHVDGRVEDA